MLTKEAPNLQGRHNWDSWDSLEGLPELDQRTPFQRSGQGALTWLGERTPGFLLAAALALAADELALWIGHVLLRMPSSPITGIPVAVVLGLVLCNTVGVPAVFHVGLRVCMRQLQRLAIMLLGLRLSLSALGGIGFDGLPVVVVTITVALVFVPFIGARVGLSRPLATLIAVGTSICGVSAIMATAPTIDAKESEISYAVGCVVIFGMLAMLTYPFLVPLLGLHDDRSIGMFLGTAIHDTAQVTGAALSYQRLHQAPEVLNIATVIKIIRNFSMVAVIPLMAALFRGPAKKKKARQSWGQFLPPFVIGFLLLVVARTVGDASDRPFGFLELHTWKSFLSVMDKTSTWLLTVAMAAIGLGTGLKQLRQLGVKPLAVGFTAAITVGACSLGMLKLWSVIAGK